VPRSRMDGAIPPLLQLASTAWCLVKKHRDNFTLLYIILFYFTLLYFLYCLFNDL